MGRRLYCVRGGQRQKGDYRDRVHSDQMVLRLSCRGRLDCVSSGQKTPRKPKKQGGLPGLSPLRSDGSRQAGRLDRVTCGQWHSRKSQQMTLGSRGTYYMGQSDSPNRRDYSLSFRDDEYLRMLLMKMMRWEPKWSHRSMWQQMNTEGLSVCTQIL